MTILSHKLGPGSLTFGEVASEQEFAAQLRSCSLTPDTEEEDPIDVLSGEQIDGDETYTYTIGGSILDGYTMESLAVWAHQNKGTVMPFEFIPNADITGAMKWTGQAKIRPIAHGGDVKSRNENDFEFKIIGDPTPAAVA
ncbi:hypothetical protein [Glutamicibacter halophytocola]|uniref:hypothetical protein n=1 Tax=Glutamicibacter halophytocola TaxID=1933880 RepID=UPI0015C556B3|nr:hypothetical protein [Glutamicibacter halophytocola]NQD40916.1 hypothetical protein [Glutamicibacter halophytocola]